MSAKADNLVRISRFLSLVLRHKPWTIGLDLDSHGWASVDELIEKAAPRRALTRELIEKVVHGNDKQRFALSADGTRIRANQGHSIEIDIGLEMQVPPDVLYHGTATRFLAAIKAEGLKRGKRHHVHLSPDADTARAVGARYGKPVVLRIDAKGMHEQGMAFFVSANGVWLTERVPASYIRQTDPASV